MFCVGSVLSIAERGFCRFNFEIEGLLGLLFCWCGFAVLTFPKTRPKSSTRTVMKRRLPFGASHLFFDAFIFSFRNVCVFFVNSSRDVIALVKGVWHVCNVYAS